jgi:hypothetical protein
MIEERLALLLKFLETKMCSFGLILKVLVFEVDVVKGVVRKEATYRWLLHLLISKVESNVKFNVLPHHNILPLQSQRSPNL